MNKKIIGLIVVIVVIIVGLFAVNTFLREEVIDETPVVIDEEEIVEEYIVIADMIIVPDQADGNEIFVERLELLEAGYVVIHRVDMIEIDVVCEIGDEECVDSREMPGVIIGVSELFQAGIYENIIVSLNEGEETTVDERIIAMIHTESDITENIKEFNPKEDLPSIINEKVVMVTFTILADDVIGFETKL